MTENEGGKRERQRQMMDYSKQALELVRRIRPLLAGRHPSVQGAALAELTAIWLHGHVVLGDANQRQELQAELFEEHLKYIWALLEGDGRHSE
jgi:hypothetical protein